MFNFINTWYKRYFTDPQASLLVILLAFGLHLYGFSLKKAGWVTGTLPGLLLLYASSQVI